MANGEGKGNPVLSEYVRLPRAVHVLCVGMLINRAGAFFTIFLTIYLSEELGFGVPFATFAMGVAGLGAMLGAICGGQLADQIGRRPVMLAAVFGSAVMLLVLSVISQRLPFLFAIFAFSFINDMYRPAGSAMIGDLVPADRSQHAFGLMFISINLGFAIAPTLGGMLADYSFRWLFWGDAITTASFGLMIVAFIRETKPQIEANQERKPSVHQDTATVVQAIKYIASDTTFLLFCLATLLNALLMTQGFSTLPIAMLENGYTKAEFGRIIAINGVLIVCAQLPLTSLLSRFDRLTVIASGALLIAIGFGSNAFGSSLPFVVMAIIIWTAGEMFKAPFMQAVVLDLAPKQLRARYQGVFSMCFALSVVLGAPLGGQILNRYGSTVLWKCVFFVGVLSACLYLLSASAIRLRSNARHETKTKFAEEPAS